MEIDIISNLPDSVLSYILSFLPSTKQVVATSILSNRWRYVWTTVDKLIFVICPENRNQKLRKNFAQSVYRVLQLHQGNIKEFTMYCCRDGCDDIDITAWINNVISRGIQKLEIDTRFVYKCPLSILSCQTLVDLKITSIDFSKMNVVVAPFFRCLKKLHLAFLSSDIESFKCVISQCPALETLIIDMYKTPFVIVSSSMKWLELHWTPFARFDSKVFLGVPSLEYLHISYVLPSDFVVEEELRLLVKADIILRDSDSRNVVNAQQLRDSFVRFAKPLSNVKVLRLECHFEKFLNPVGHGQFLNLTNLEIVSQFFEWRLLVSLMESINLEAITLKKTYTNKNYKLAWEEPKHVPPCLSSSLKKLTILGYSEDELPMVKYVLGKAEILQRMEIRFSYSYIDDELTYDMLQNIMKLHRACERCKILFL